MTHLKFNLSILYEMPFSRKSQYNTQSYLARVIASWCVNPQEVLKYSATRLSVKILKNQVSFQIKLPFHPFGLNIKPQFAIFLNDYFS